MAASRSWCFTINNPAPRHLTFFTECECTRVVIGEETGESGTLHYQGFITWRRAYRLAQLKKLVPEAHWEVAKCADAANYCMKEKIILNKKTEHQGKRRDLETAYELARSGQPLKVYLQTSPGLQAIKLFEKVQYEYQPDRLFKPTVFWL